MKGMNVDRVIVDEAAFFDPTSQDHFDSVDDQICLETINVALPGHTEAGLRLQCEIDGEHDEHEATLRWTTEVKKGTEGG